MTRVYEELIDFIARGNTSAEVVAYQPSTEVKARVAELLSRQKNGELSPEDLDELDHYLELEHIMRLAKARARGQSR